VKYGTMPYFVSLATTPVPLIVNGGNKLVREDAAAEV